MLVLASFVTVNFGHLRARWHGMPTPANVLGPSGPVDSNRQGSLGLFDTATGECLWTLQLESPAGFCIVDRRIYVASMVGNRIYTLGEDLGLEDSFSSGLMNDLHTAAVDGDGIILTSSGTDAIIRYSFEGKKTWSWLAPDHGYNRTSAGQRRRVRESVDYRLAGNVATPDQTTHINSALPTTIEGCDAILATLFHQGELITIDRRTGAARVLLRGLNRPHSIRPRSQGWSLCSSGDSVVALLDSDFSIVSILKRDFDWVQDAVEVDPERMLIADANNHRLVVWDYADQVATDVVHYSSDWKIYQIEVLAGPTGDWLRGCQPFGVGS